MLHSGNETENTPPDIKGASGTSQQNTRKEERRKREDWIDERERA